jgi:protein arginine N-methyltransferase 1
MLESYEYYAALLRDSFRIRQWEAAIRQAVKPGDAVVEIGTGVGTFGFFAVRAGAAKVYAIEADRVLDVAREVAAAGGLLDRMEFIEGYSTAVAIPEIADVVLYEDFAPHFFDTDTSKILSDARRRFLKPGGVLLPRRACLYSALFEDEKTYREIDPLGREAGDLFGLDFTPLRELTLNALGDHDLTGEHLLTDAAIVYSIDLQKETVEPFTSRHTFTMRRAGTAHGLALWFDLDLGEGITISNTPSTTVASWGQASLPFEQPIPLAAGESVEVEIRTVVSKFYGSFWTWTVRKSGVGSSRPFLLRQTSFRGQPLPEALAPYLRLEASALSSRAQSC